MDLIPLTNIPLTSVPLRLCVKIFVLNCALAAAVSPTAIQID